METAQFIAAVTESGNIAEQLADDRLKSIAKTVLDEYRLDKASMSDWLDKMQDGIDLAALVKEDKDYPFVGSANVKYPLVTSAALQFNARLYPVIAAADRPVKARVWGDDRDGSKAARADRVSEHMSFQLLSEVEEWEESTDNLLLQLPIVGTMYRKWWYDPAFGRLRCRLIDPGKLIVNDKVKTFADAPRCTEELSLYPTEIEERIRTGRFIEFEYDPDPEDDQGPQEFIEQHTRLDLDEDGYPEPYVVTVHVDKETIVGIVADFSEADVAYEMKTEVVPQSVAVPDPMSGLPVEMMQLAEVQVPAGIKAIRRGSYFTCYKAFPSVTGGHHGMGLGLLLGDISESINTMFNMLIDAGHYASLGGGFIGSGIRLKGGSQRMRPGEWKMVPDSGVDISRSFVPMTFPGPDKTLYEMLGMLIEAGREIASVQTVLTGEMPAGNTPATTTMAVIQQGMTQFTAVTKRIFRGLRGEFKLIAGMNAKTLDPQAYAAFHDAKSKDGQPQQVDPQQDYNLADMDIQPVADPNSVTKMQQAAKAQFLMQLSDMGMVDRTEALSRMSQAMDIEDVESLLPQPDPVQQQMIALQMEAARADVADKSAKIQLTMAQIEEIRAGVMKMMADAQNEGDRLALDAQKARWDVMLKALEDDRKRLEAVLKGSPGMATKPGNGDGNQGTQTRLGAAEKTAVRSLLEGGTGAGFSTGGSSYDGGPY